MGIRNIEYDSKFVENVETVSVPLRGNGYKERKGLIGGKCPQELSVTFPSPCGEMGIRNQKNVR